MKKHRSISLALALAAGSLAAVSSASAQTASYTGSNYTQNFDGATTQALTSVIGQHVALSSLPGWHVAKAAGSGSSNMPFNTGTGGANTGGMYLLGSGELALGSLASGSNTPVFGVAITNNAANALSSFTISFDAEQWRSSTSVANSLVFSWGTSASGITTSDFLTNAAMTANAGGDIVGAAPVASNGAINPPLVTPVTLTISGVNIAPGETIFFRWRDTDNSGNDAALAIDNFVFSADGSGGGAANIIKNVAASPATLQVVPGNIHYTITGITNTGASNAAPATITATFPAGVTFNAGATTLPPGVTADFTGGVLTLNLGAVAGGGVIPDFTVVMTTTVEFPEGSPLAVSFASAPGTDVDNTSVIAFNNTTTVQANDLVHGLSVGSAADTLRLIRPAAGPGLLADGWDAPFIQSVEFDNKNNRKGNPAGNLLGLNFGTLGTGGTIHAFPTQSMGLPSTLLGSFTDSVTFTHGATSSLLVRGRLGGLSVSPCNDKIAVSVYETGAFYVFDYANTGDGQGALSNGRAMDDGINNSAASMTVGTTWIDNDHFVAAQPTAGGLVVTCYAVTASSVTAVSSTVLPVSGLTFTDVEFNPGVPAPLNTKLIVTGSNFVASVTTNKLWVLDAPTAPTYTFSEPLIAADYSASMQSTREIALDSFGNLFLSQFGGASAGNIPVIEVIPFNANLAAMFVNNASADFFSGPALASSFNGLDIAANTLLPPTPTCGEQPTQRCQPADIASDDGTPLPTDLITHPNGGVNEGDYNSFFQGFFAAADNCDIANDDATPRAPFGANATNGGVNEGDYNCFFQLFFNGCP